MNRIALPVKIAYTVFVAVLVPYCAGRLLSGAGGSASREH